jgi:hypothetical protein
LLHGPIDRRFEKEEEVVAARQTTWEVAKMLLLDTLQGKSVPQAVEVVQEQRTRRLVTAARKNAFAVRGLARSRGTSVSARFRSASATSRIGES